MPTISVPSGSTVTVGGSDSGGDPRHFIWLVGGIFGVLVLGIYLMQFNVSPKTSMIIVAFSLVIVLVSTVYPDIWEDLGFIASLHLILIQLFKLIKRGIKYDYKNKIAPAYTFCKKFVNSLNPILKKFIICIFIFLVLLISQIYLNTDDNQRKISDCRYSVYCDGILSKLISSVYFDWQLGQDRYLTIYVIYYIPILLIVVFFILSLYFLIKYLFKRRYTKKLNFTK